MAVRKEETLIDFITSIPWPFWVMFGIIVAILLWILIFERDEPQVPIWHKDAWNRLNKRTWKRNSD